MIQGSNIVSYYVTTGAQSSGTTSHLAKTTCVTERVTVVRRAIQEDISSRFPAGQTSLENSYYINRTTEDVRLSAVAVYGRTKIFTDNRTRGSD